MDLGFTSYNSEHDNIKWDKSHGIRSERYGDLTTKTVSKIIDGEV